MVADPHPFRCFLVHSHQPPSLSPYRAVWRRPSRAANLRFIFHLSAMLPADSPATQTESIRADAAIPLFVGDRNVSNCLTSQIVSKENHHEPERPRTPTDRIHP